jgi:hypothetical protein
MKKFFKEFQDDVIFVKSHHLQPSWYKYSKIFILLFFLAVYGYIFGFVKTIIFLVSFLILSFLVHMLYRVKTQKWQKNWLDFQTVTEDTTGVKRIGIYYYSMVVVNLFIALLISQALG